MNHFNRNKRKGKDMEKTTAIRKMVIALTILTMAIFSTVIADENKGTEQEKPELLTPVQQRMQQEISIDFRETPIADVLDIMAKQAMSILSRAPRLKVW